MKRQLAQKWLPVRRKTDNKTHGGRVLIWAGSAQMPGAAILAAEAASRSGAGYVYTSTKEVLNILPHVIPWKKKYFKSIDSVLIGPGLGLNNTLSKSISILKKTKFPVVIDADALTVSAKNKDFPFPPYWIATPHSGELSRFLGVSAKKIDSNRLKYARLAQKKLGCIVVLKGHQTIVAFPSCNVIIPTGNVSLAKAGTGDVLGGMIAGFLSQNVSPEKAALLACYIHGLLADQWIRSGSDNLSLIPPDLIKFLPATISKLRR